VPQLYNDNVGEVLRKYSADSSVTVGPGEANVSATGVQQIVAGVNIVLDPPDGQGIVTVSAAGLSSPWVHFDVSSNANALQFSNVNLSVYDYGNQITTFRNGILIDPAKIVKVGANTIQINECLFAGDTIDVIAQSLAELGTDSELSVLANGAVIGTANALNFVGATITVVNNQANITIPSSYGNANVAAYLPTYTGNVGTGAGYILGNGALLTGIVSSNYSNANVANYLPTYGGNVGTGAGYILGNGSLLSGISANYGNTNIAAYLQVLTSNVTTTANVSASYLLGNGSQISNIVTSITSGGNLTISPISGQGAVTITNKLYANGYGYNSYTANVGNVSLRGLGPIRYDQAKVQPPNLPTYKPLAHVHCNISPGLTIGNISSVTPGAGVFESYSIDQVTLDGAPSVGVYANQFYRFLLSSDSTDAYPAQASFIGYANSYSGNTLFITDICGITDQGIPGVNTVISNGASYSNFIFQQLLEYDTPYLVDGNIANGVSYFDFVNFTAGPNIGLTIAAETIGANTGPNLHISLAVTNASSPSDTGNSQGWLQFTLGNGAPAWVAYYR